ncbi:mannitol dehydrogenase family protein [Clostridium sp. HBUAS56010]|uniref:mannitol dehydrogenase family protein n=1 Tax=Clostridium sp. HBUAS56010 TaxID=2571127 RepID=UPI0011788AF9|nr:mannitol dehydrogenase family protein [Clostridium sp. HBUAS56010]
MKLNRSCFANKDSFQKISVKLPEFDWEEMRKNTEESPRWVHFGAGNIFRGFIAQLQQQLLENGMEQSGIIAADTFDFDIIDQIYHPYDNMTMMVRLKPDGTMEKEVIASVAKAVKASVKEKADFAYLVRAFENPSLQMASFTITEKGYALTDLKGELFPVVKKDMEEGPDQAVHAMGVVTSLLLKRYLAGGHPLALVSMDNCSHNGEKLKISVTSIAQAWVDAGFAEEGFKDWIQNETKVSFPWSMIDKITPRPAPVVQKALEEAGIEDMAPVITSKNTYIAPFVNAEVPQYLVIEDRFPAGRPALEKAGVYMTDRDTVNKTERMKVTTCLNPLHTALAVYGCLLGYESIAAEMKDEDLKALVERIGYVEGIPVVTDPEILSPMEFIKEVIEYRLPNPFIPDTPQRIATDTSQKIAIRFGETIKAYLEDEALDVQSLTGIPLAISGWLRYLNGEDDKGQPMEISSDPMLEDLKEQLRGEDTLSSILSNPVLFGTDLVQAGLSGKIEKMYRQMLAGPGSVRKTLQELRTASH